LSRDNHGQGVDLATGALRRNDAKAISPNAVTRDICPAWPGATGGDGTSLAASAFSPQTRLLYIPANRLCMDMEARDANFMAGTPFMGTNLRMTPTPGTSRGALIAWDVEAGKPAWVADEAFPVEGGVLTTAGGCSTEPWMECCSRVPRGWLLLGEHDRKRLIALRPYCAR
jgi:alcohol dehydrogenase (cytochrome c)